MDTYCSAIEVSIVGWRAQPTNNNFKNFQKNNSVNAARALHCTPLEFRTGFLAGGF